jgi:hypothetical protein
MDAPDRTRSTAVVDRDLNPFDRLSSVERRRLMVRVLCGLVAYDEPAEPVANVDLVLDLRVQPTASVPTESAPGEAVPPERVLG